MPKIDWKWVAIFALFISQIIQYDIPRMSQREIIRNDTALSRKIDANRKDLNERWMELIKILTDYDDNFHHIDILYRDIWGDRQSICKNERFKNFCEKYNDAR